MEKGTIGPFFLGILMYSELKVTIGDMWFITGHGARLKQNYRALQTNSSIGKGDKF
jgi:hypothetical protein